MPNIDSRFEALVTYLTAHEKEVAESVDKQEPRPWMNFSGDDLETKAEDKKEATLHDVFSRDKANEDYTKARNDEEAKSNETALPKLAGDFMAAFERDKREQWRSRIRTIAHAQSRRAGNGQDEGPIRRHTMEFLSRIFMKAEEKEPNG